MNTPTIQVGTKFYVPVSEDANAAGFYSVQVTDNTSLSGWNVTIPDDYYKIKVNVIAETLSGETFIARDDLFIVGGATEIGWDSRQAIRFEKDSTNPNLYIYAGILKEAKSGEDRNMIKILSQKDWEPDSYHPGTQNESLLESKYVLKNLSGDHKWSINSDKPGNYIIKIDLFDETVSATYHGGTPKQEKK